MQVSYKTINIDKGACIVCSGTAKEYVIFCSRWNYTRVYLCLEHYEALHDKMLEVLGLIKK